MRDIKNILKNTVDKIKSGLEHKDIPLADAFAQMDKELDEAEKAYGKSMFPQDEKISMDEYCYKVMGFKNPVNFDEIKARYEALLAKYNPSNFANDNEKQIKAAKKIDLINKAYQHFEKKHVNNTQEME